MKPIEFPEQNKLIAKDQPQYIPLPSYVDHYDQTGPVIFCMGLSFRERITLLFTGKLWCQLLTFGGKLQPSMFSVNKEDMLLDIRIEIERAVGQ